MIPTRKKNGSLRLIVGTVILMGSSNLSVAEKLKWQGFYAGAGVGIALNHNQLKANQLGLIGLTGTCSTSSTYLRGLPGFTFGYAQQFKSKMIIAIEGNITHTTNYGYDAVCPCPIIEANVADRFSINNHLQSSIRLRLGHQVNHNFFPYLMAGKSFSDTKMIYSNEGGDYYAKHASKQGWLIGLGLEWKPCHHWSLRGEVSHLNYNKFKMPLPTIYQLNDPNGRATSRLRNNQISLTIAYWIT